MKTGKFLALAAFTGAAILLLRTNKGKKIRKELMDAAGDWSESFSELAEKASCTAKDLQKMVSKQIAGLSDDARERIATIIDEGSKSANKLRKSAASQF